MRTLVVIRHAKAHQAVATDLERPLTRGGLADAADAGSWLASQLVVPDAALVSAAVRTVQTWHAVALAAGWELEPTIDDALYESGAQNVLDLVHAVRADVQTLVLVGHNPSMASLSLLLGDGEGEDAVLIEVAMGFPTGAVAVFGYDGAWADLMPAGARLARFHVGRG